MSRRESVAVIATKNPAMDAELERDIAIKVSTLRTAGSAAASWRATAAFSSAASLVSW